ncbi:stimulated by retinoic acid gene 6 protein-like [Pomacea canaliculata]|uniref:stimulated by retinoic acid gene 6 protein-like n=1 Tax=Pomacea canaliculata TaxID=400727 RepID=UPI000D73E6ED|nr:stimulated by retinoic acid gene 6 protein-like [Pomacea canaliculata]XP_025079487.1 stimulated by retinoic acid gene 6 protein-like [Pomacea canaliculata]XP_025079488.1 stimulated by retinoic acid gene 6 protein-like [Pomacea canaliculata]
MSAKLINSVNKFYNNYEAYNSSDAIPDCKSRIDHQDFYQFSLIPAVLVTLSFAFTRHRRNMLLSLMGGRPGLVYPMDALTRSSRISYACAFGATAFLVYEIVMEQRLIIDTPTHKAAKSFAAILSVLVYGMVFFPVFACLALSSAFGFGLGALYVWMLLGVQIFKLTECQTTGEVRLLMVLQSLPNLLCLLYLSVSIPGRSLRSLSKGRFFSWYQDSKDSMDKIKECYAGLHVRKLFRKPKVKKPVVGKLAAMKAAVKRLLSRFVYRRKKGFRYPARMLSVMIVGMIVVYILAFQLFLEVPRDIEGVRDLVWTSVDESIGWEESEDDDDLTKLARTLLLLFCYFLDIVIISITVGLSLALLLCLLNILHSLSSYRATILALYRGDHSHIPPPDAGSYVNYCVNSIKYGGFQVAYIVWAFFVQFGVLSLICFALGVLIQVLSLGYKELLLAALEYIWPIVLVTIILMVVQKLLAKFVFLQKKGLHLALDNRYCYFIFTYFMFFYNIFLGLVSCLLRIVKAFVLGIAFLGRLDNSTLSRKFEFFDPGFSAYLGFMHIECAHTHPVVIVFTRLVIHMWETAKERQIGESNTCSNGDLLLNMNLDDLSVRSLREDTRRRSMKARSNWHVTYTLLHNPELRVTRKGYMQLLRQARELGVHIPISDNQANINLDSLAEQILQAKDSASNKNAEVTKQAKNRKQEKV